MSSIDKDLKRAETLMNEGKDYEAIPILKKLVEKPTLSLSDEILLSSVLIRLGDWDNTVKIAEQAYQKAQNSQDYLQSINAILNMAYALTIIGDLDKSSKLLEKSEELYSMLSKDPQANLEEVEAYKAHIKGSLSFFLGKKEDSLKYMKMSLELREKIGNKQDIAESLLGLSNFYRLSELDFDRAFYYTNQCLKIVEEIHYQRLISSVHFNLGFYHSFKGELEKALSYYKLAFPYFEKTNNYPSYLSTMNNMALVYKTQGKLDKSVELLAKSIKLAEKKKISWIKSGCNVSMVEVYLAKGDIKKAKEHSEKVKQLYNTEKTPVIYRDYKYTEALILKKSPRVQNRAKAENLFRSLIQDENTVYEIKIEGLIQLCDLLIDELKTTGEMEIVNEIKPLIKQLLIFTKQSRSYWYYTETYVLQAKLALLTLDIKKARQLLTKAQAIAEKHGFDPLVKKISNEHDELLKQLNMWENLKESTSSLKERMEFAQLNEQMDNMLRKRVVEPSEIKDEESVVILIISTGGIPIFSQSFVEGWSFKDHLFGGFLSAINSFSDEMFSQGLDRAIFGEYTIIMNAVSPFIICYLFKGQSFLAQQRMKVFIHTIQNDKKIWEPIKKYYQANRLVQVKDIPSLDLLVDEIFIKRAV